MDNWSKSSQTNYYRYPHRATIWDLGKRRCLDTAPKVCLDFLAPSSTDLP